MAMNYTQLADEIATAMGYSFTSTYILAFAHGTVDEIKNGMATFGNTPSGHTISGIDASNMATLIMGYAGYPFISPQLVAYCNGVATHIMGSGIVTYIGPPPAPPVIMPPAAWFLGGTISGLDGSACASLVKTLAGYPSVSPQLLAECTAVVDHVMANALVVSGVIS